MQENIAYIAQSVLRDMDEGLMVLGHDGRILVMNPRACEILEKDGLEGELFASAFFDDERNDDFSQSVLDAIYDHKKVLHMAMPYYAGDQLKRLYVISSDMHDEEGQHEAVILLLSDITEFEEVKEHLRMMNEIEKLNMELSERNQFLRETFARYLSDEVVDQILDTPDGLDIGGNKADITVLMGDLRGFTAMCEGIEPEAMIASLNNYFDHMGNIIRTLRGTIIEYVGDCVLAIFGEPVKLENHALTAVRAAVMMQAEMEEVNRWNREHGYPEFEMGIGISTGSAVVGNIGSRHAVKYNVIGSCVNLCGRLEGLTTGGQIFITQETRDRAGDAVITDGRFEIEAKGIKEAVTVYSVSGLGEPWNISYDASGGEIPALDEPVRAYLRKLKEKSLTDIGADILITGKGRTRMTFTLCAEGGAADPALRVFDNVYVTPEGNIPEMGAESFYGKITGVREEGYILTVTAKASV